MRSVQIAPGYALHREVAATDGAGPYTNKKQGINLGHYQTAHVQVVPINTPEAKDATALGTGNPGVEVLFWNELLERWVKTNPVTTVTGAGGGVPYEFDVACGGRMMMVAVPGAVVAGEGVAIYVSGYDLDHTL